MRWPFVSSTYTLIRPDEPLTQNAPGPRVYLGGNSRGRDWRLEFFQTFERAEVTFINPKREVFIDPDFDPVGHAGQVEWERKALDLCDVGVFWLGGGLPNQAARVEMGYLLGARKPLLVGAEKGFMGLEHLSAFSGLVLTNTIEGLIGRFGSLMTEFKAS